MENTKMALIRLEKLIEQLIKAKKNKAVTREMRKNLDLNLEICKNQMDIIKKQKSGKYIAW